jgi:ribosome biogenesis GTPase / thiamine phosphate phosphatase
MQGKIIKGIAGFYYIHVPEHGIYECKAKGGFRNQKIKPLVGDMVEFDVIDEAEKKGNIVSILPRLNALIRPSVANVAQAMIIFAIQEPEPNLGLLDRFLITMQQQDLKTIICFNKCDLTSEARKQELTEIYQGCGYEVLFISVEKQQGIDAVQEKLKGMTTVLAGPSGVGKSSLMNQLNPQLEVQTGAVSEKIKRGRHTTRHSEIFYLGEDTYLMDTPGFTSLYVKDVEADELKYYYSEFEPYEGKCRFNGCAHVHEPDCAVKTAVGEGIIHKLRYDSYINLYEELKSQRRY